MDGRRFDLLSRWLVTRNSRRTSLRALAAGAVAIGLGRLGLEEADAKCVKPGKKCKSKNGKKKNCCDGAKCKGKKCKCTGGTEACDGECVAACQAGVQARNPLDCSCCQVNGTPPSPGCASFGPCCSGVCIPLGGGLGVCAGRSPGAACEFDAQCQNNDCRDGTCACDEECCTDADCPPDGQCGNNTCHFPPDCTGSGQHCDSASECCGPVCLTPEEVCVPSASGQPCHVDNDCVSDNCVLFVCE